MISLLNQNDIRLNIPFKIYHSLAGGEQSGLITRLGMNTNIAGPDITLSVPACKIDLIVPQRTDHHIADHAVVLVLVVLGWR